MRRAEIPLSYSNLLARLFSTFALEFVELFPGRVQRPFLATGACTEDGDGGAENGAKCGAAVQDDYRTSKDQGASIPIAMDTSPSMIACAARPSANAMARVHSTADSIAAAMPNCGGHVEIHPDRARATLK